MADNLCPTFCYKCEYCGAVRCILRPMGHANWPLPCKKCGEEMHREAKLEDDDVIAEEL